MRPDFVFVPAEEADGYRDRAREVIVSASVASWLTFESVTRYLPPTMEPVEYVKVPAWLVEM